VNQLTRSMQIESWDIGVSFLSLTSECADANTDGCSQRSSSTNVQEVRTSDSKEETLRSERQAKCRSVVDSCMRQLGKKYIWQVI